MSSTHSRPVYDAALALALAGGRPAIRDQLLAGVLAFLEDPDRGGRLREISHYRHDPLACYELAHRAVGLTRQAGLGQLEALLRALSDALEAGDLTEAERLGQALPAALDAAHAALGHVVG